LHVPTALVQTCDNQWQTLQQNLPRRIVPVDVLAAEAGMKQEALRQGTLL
jgi:hypothetical protein